MIEILKQNPEEQIIFYGLKITWKKPFRKVMSLYFW